MKVGSNPEASRAAGVAQGAAQTTPRGKFSEILKDKKDRRDPAVSEDLNGEPTLLNDAAAGLASATPPAPANVAVVDSGQAAAPSSEALVASLVREITVQLPPGSAKSVDIQFDSHTLQGLHVRIQKADSGLNVQFATSSEAVSRLLTSNAPALTEALQQRGYVAPVISVQRPEGPATFASGDSRSSSRDRGGRNGNEQGGGGQKRR
jgi:flagellar hook-length control protein FliK